MAFMPTLTWISTETVVAHHKEVPLHLRVELQTCTDKFYPDFVFACGKIVSY